MGAKKKKSVGLLVFNHLWLRITVLSTVQGKKQFDN